MTSTMKNVRLLAIAIAVLCAIAFMPLLSDSMQSHAASKLKVSKTKVTVTVGKAVKVTANKKATWKSAKTTVANITATKGKAISNTFLKNCRNSKSSQVQKKNHRQWNACFPGRKHFRSNATNGTAEKRCLLLSGHSLFTTYGLMS